MRGRKSVERSPYSVVAEDNTSRARDSDAAFHFVARDSSDATALTSIGGATMEIFCFLSAVLVLATYFLYCGSKREIALGIGMMLFGLLGTLASGFLLLWSNFAALLLMTALFRPWQWSTFRFLGAGFSTSLLLCGIFGGLYLSRYRELATFRDQYPPISMEDRLAYEVRLHPVE